MIQTKKVLSILISLITLVGFSLMLIYYLLKLNNVITLIMLLPTIEDGEAALVYFFNISSYFASLLTWGVGFIVSLYCLIKVIIEKNNLTLILNKCIAKVINSFIALMLISHLVYQALYIAFANTIDVFTFMLIIFSFILGIIASSFIRSRKKSLGFALTLFILFLIYLIFEFIYIFSPKVINLGMIVISYLLIGISTIILIVYDVIYLKNDFQEEKLQKAYGNNPLESHVTSNLNSEQKASTLNEKFKELEKLHQQGLLTDEEYSKAKAEAIRKYL